MALITCSECSSEVSSNAAACPKCGNPIAAVATAPEPVLRLGNNDGPGIKTARKAAVGALGLTVLIVLAAHVFGGDSGPQAGDASSAEPSSDAAAPEIASDTAAPATAPAEPPTPPHNYATQDGGEYGYQPDISDEERNRGVATKALVMVRYRGEKDGTYTIEMNDDSGMVARFTCHDACNYVKSQILAGGEIVKTETMPNNPGSLMHAVFEDAMNGQLDPYRN